MKQRCNLSLNALRELGISPELLKTKNHVIAVDTKTALTTCLLNYGYSYRDIARLLDIAHTTVIYYSRRHSDYLDRNADYSRTFWYIKSLIDDHFNSLNVSSKILSTT